MNHSVIRYCIDLVIYLVDTTSGSFLSQKNVILFQNNTILNPMKKGIGTYILCNHGRNDFVLTVEAFGYESSCINVNFESFDKGIPTVYVPMIPKISIENDAILSEIRGNLSGLEKIDAVTTEDKSLYLNKFDEKIQTITLFNYLEKPIHNIEYAVINPEKTEYEAFKIVRELHKHQFEIQSPLKKYWESNSILSRVIYGKVESNGDYILRIRKGNRQKYIVRYVLGGAERFECLEI